MVQPTRIWRFGVLLTILAACGDDDGSSTGSGGASTTATSSSTGVTKSNGSGGEDSAPQPCTLAEAEDQTNDDTVTITSQGVAYTPRCVRVAAGTSVTFVSDFDAHPLRGGEVIDEVGIVDQSSPITPQDSGTTVTFVLPDAGEFPYFCSFHASIGMFGTIWVE